MAADKKSLNRILDASIHFLSRWGWTLIGALAPTAFFLPTGTGIPLLLLLLVWASRKRQRGHFIPRTPLDLPILVLSVSVAAGLLLMGNPQEVLLRASGYVYSVALYYELVELAARDRCWWQGTFAAYLIGGVGLAALALFGTDWLYKVDDFEPITRSLPPRLSQLIGPEGTFHPNIVAGTLLHLLPPLAAAAVAGFVFRGRTEGESTLSRKLKLPLTAGLLFVLTVFMLLQSRGAYLGLAVAIVFALFVGLRAWQGWSIQALGLLVLVSIGAIALLALVLFPPTFGLRSGLDGVLDWFQSFPQRRTMAGRIEHWGNALKLFRSSPIIGVGLGAFEPAVRQQFTLHVVPESSNFVHAHNHIMTVLVELGLTGLVGYVWLWLAVGIELLRRWRKAIYEADRALLLGFACALLAYFVYGMTDTIALGTKPGVLFWYLLGLLVSFDPAFVAGVDTEGRQCAGGKPERPAQR